jgi:hypothetical protein
MPIRVKLRSRRPRRSLEGRRPTYLKTADLIRDTLGLIPKLPEDVVAVAGIPRSGMLPASVLALHLHLPLLELAGDGTLRELSHGWRMKNHRPRPGRVLVIDDTAMTGRSVRKAKEAFSQHSTLNTQLLWSVVYRNPDRPADVDVWSVELPGPHLLEWNLFNSVFVPVSAFDFDGVLCEDCPTADDDDGPRYERFLATARPLHLPRKTIVPRIVTARLEKWRPQTEAWLRRWGVQCEQLIMGPWASLEERRERGAVAAWKATHFRAFAERLSRDRLHRPFDGWGPFFVESCVKQAREIAVLSGMTTICPTTADVFAGDMASAAA